MKKKWIDAFMDTAERFAQLSSAKRLKVGAVVVKTTASSLSVITVHLLVGITAARKISMMIMVIG